MKEILQQSYKSKMAKIVIFSFLISLTACSNSNIEKSKINVEINGPSKYPNDIKNNIKTVLDEQSK